MIFNPNLTFIKSPVCVIVGDANNDGYDDIITTNYGSNTVSIIQWNVYYGDWDTHITRSVGFEPTDQVNKQNG